MCLKTWYLYHWVVESDMWTAMYISGVLRFTAFPKIHKQDAERNLQNNLRTQQTGCFCWCSSKMPSNLIFSKGLSSFPRLQNSQMWSQMNSRKTSEVHTVERCLKKTQRDSWGTNMDQSVFVHRLSSNIKRLLHLLFAAPNTETIQRTLWASDRIISIIQSEQNVPSVFFTDAGLKGKWNLTECCRNES